MALRWWNQLIMPSAKVFIAIELEHVGRVGGPPWVMTNTRSKTRSASMARKSNASISAGQMSGKVTWRTFANAWRHRCSRPLKPLRDGLQPGQNNQRREWRGLPNFGGHDR